MERLKASSGSWFYLAVVSVLAGLFMLAGPTAASAAGAETWAKKYPGEPYLFSTERTSDNGFIVASNIVMN